MIFCEKYSDLIDDLLEDELDEHHTAWAESHMSACLGCRERYETLRQAKEIYAQYLFDAEPPPNSWANFQVRLNSENEKAKDEEVVAASWFYRRQGMFGFSFFPAAAAFAALLFVGGIGFVLLPPEFEKDGDQYVAVTENSPTPAPSNATDEKQAINSPAQAVAFDGAPKNNDLLAESKSLKAKSSSLFGKKSLAEPVQITQKSASSNEGGKSVSGLRLKKENRLSDLRARDLEIEITGQMEKVELLLRSFRNARANETVEGFDIEYEKGQARKLLGKNVQLRRDAENYGISYAEELLSQIEPYLLDIANLGANPAPEKVLDIKERIISRNIIASLQVYSRDAA